MPEGDPARSPWEELAQQAQRGLNADRSRVSARDHALHAAVRAGNPVRELAERIGISVQAVYQAVDRVERELGAQAGSGYSVTATALAQLTDAVAFEELANVLLAELFPDLRPTQRSGDRGRDAVAGIYAAGDGEQVIVTISLEKEWAAKIRKDMRRVAEQRLRPAHHYAVTNRDADEKRLEALRAEALEHGWSLTVLDGRWMATQLTRPEHADLRGDYLGLAAPRPRLFLTPEEFAELSAAAHPEMPQRLVGRNAELSEISSYLEQRRTVIVEAPGGIGKTRLLSELAGRDQRRRWLFVRDGLPCAPDVLHETGVGDELVIVVDDAHRRSDLRALLAMLERRTPRPRLVLICRPGFSERMHTALEGLAHDPPVGFPLRPLTRAAIAELLEQPPLEVRFGGARSAIVDLAQGNVQIAMIAAELASKGVALHELSGDELMRSYVAAVLRDAAGDSRERLALIALIAAVGQLGLSGEPLTHASELLGLAEAHMRREIADLADRGILVEEHGRAFIKPDLLAERILVGCFFDRSWRPALSYGDIYRRFAPSQRLAMLSMLGQAMVSASSEARGSAELRVVRGDVLGACADAQTAETRAAAADALGAVAPGLPALAIEGFDVLVGVVPPHDEPLLALCGPLLDVLTRVPIFDAGWQRLLTLAQRVFATVLIDDPFPQSRGSRSDAASSAIKRLADAFDVHRRVPVDQSPHDSLVLAGVQEAMAQITPRWWARARGKPGAANAAVHAADALLTVIYEISRLDAANPMQVNLITVGVPASEFTEHCLGAGVTLLLECLPELSLRGQVRAIEVLHKFAHPALGFPGPFGLQLSGETQAIINRLLAELVVPWFGERLETLPAPVAAEAVELFEWRSHFGQRPADLRGPEALREYRELMQRAPHSDLDTQPGEWRAREQRIAERHAQALLADPDPLERIELWSSWYELRREAKGDPPHHQTLPMALERVAQEDSARGVQIIEYLLERDSPMLSQAHVAMIEALKVEPERALRWARSTSATGRATLAWAAAHLEDDHLQHEIFEGLAEDAEPGVRSAAVRALRYRTDLQGWRAELALGLVARDGDLEMLAELLQRLAEAEPPTNLRPEQIREARSAVLAAALKPQPREAHPIAEAIESLRKLGHDLLWEWLWARLETLESDRAARLRVIEALPTPVMTLVTEHADTPQGEAHLVRALTLLDRDEPTDVLIDFPLLDLVVALGHEDIVVARVREWATGSNLQRHRLSELLRRVSDPSVFERYASIALAADSSPEIESLIIFAREPTSFFGSRVPYYEAAREQFNSWKAHGDGNLVRVAHKADEIFDERIAAAQAYERQIREESFG